MVAVLIINIIGLILLLAIITMIFVCYIKERRRYEDKIKEQKQTIDYYMKELKRRSDNGEV